MSIGLSRLRFTSKMCIIEPLNIYGCFDPKWQKNGVTKTPFKKATIFFSEILVEDVKFMLHKVLKVSHRYLLPFLSDRKSPAGGRI